MTDYTTAEVAERLGVKRVTVLGWLNRQGGSLLPGAVKRGRDWLIPEETLAAFVPPNPRGGRPRKPRPPKRPPGRPRKVREEEGPASGPG